MPNLNPDLIAGLRRRRYHLGPFHNQPVALFNGGEEISKASPK